MREAGRALQVIVLLAVLAAGLVGCGPEEQVSPPLGSDLLFVTTRDGNREIYRLSADGTQLVNLTQLTHNQQADWAPTWFPDGSKLSFLRATADSQSDAEIYMMNPNGSGETKITDGQEFVWGGGYTEHRGSK